MIRFSSTYVPWLLGNPLKIRIDYCVPNEERYVDVHLDGDVPPEQFFADLRKGIDMLESAYKRGTK